jgi:hypothetical protein
MANPLDHLLDDGNARLHRQKALAKEFGYSLQVDVHGIPDSPSRPKPTNTAFALARIFSVAARIFQYLAIPVP